jgi:hypothetical protein
MATRKKAKRPRKAPAPKKATSATVPDKTLVLRTCPADMIAKGEMDGVKYAMTWPRQGPVECPDWDPAPRCGNGLHGLPWGNGDWSLLSSADDAVWMVVEVDTALLVDIGGNKSKFPRGNVLFSGSRVEAVIRVLCGSEAIVHVTKEAEAWGEKCGNSSTAASSGYSSKAASSGNSSTAASSGYSSTAASSGNSSTAASSGNSSTAASSGYSSTAASSGYSSTAASSGNSSTAASSGDYSTASSDGQSGIAATIGNNGRAKAGQGGLIVVTYWVEAEQRYRACVGNVGEDGVKADTWYRVVDGKLAEVPT